MPLYRIHRIKETQAENFRWAAHTGGLAVVKPRDYEGGAEELEAATPYAAWKMLAGKQPLRPGDVLEAVTQQGSAGDLQIFKYIGFEPAKWYVPETPIATGSNGAETDGTVAVSANSIQPV
jgi:hypothetical protein